MTNRLRELRLAHNETQNDLAALLGLKSTALYCKREIGYYPVTLEEAFKLAIHWGMTGAALAQIKIDGKKFDTEICETTLYN